jgi:CheY-like chemotaxis protein
VSFAGAAAGESAVDERPAPELASLEGMRVLVVDDDVAVLDATATLLRRLGCSVITADSIEAALAAADPAPDLVLTDYQLRRGETGIALVRRLVARYPGLPAVLVTGDTAPDRLREAAESALPLLHKPVSAEALRALIAAVTQRKAPAFEASGDAAH